MWCTLCGERTLEGAEATLIREALADVVARIELSDRFELVWRSSVQLFDELTNRQKLAMLAEVGQGLLREDVSPPDLSALNEAAVAALYAHVLDSIEIEIVRNHAKLIRRKYAQRWRRLVVEAIEESELPEALEFKARSGLPDADCDHVEGWEMLVDRLKGFVLAGWVEDPDLDVDPAFWRWLNKILGPDEDHYLRVPPNPTEPELAVIRANLKALVG
jgi:hypothetical protein